jgi:hypothetical protein
MGTFTMGTPGIYSMNASHLPKRSFKPSLTGALKADYAISVTRQPFPTALKIEAKKQPIRADQFLCSPTQKKSGPLLAIVDDFETGSIPAFVKKSTPMTRLLLEAPTNGLVSHGHIVEAHAKIANPDIQIYRVQTPQTRNMALQALGKTHSDIPAALRMLNKTLETDNSIDAINLSYGLAMPIKRFQEDLNLPGLNANNIHLYRDTILKNFDKLQFSPPVLGIKGLHWPDNGKKKYIQEAMQLLGEIAKKKTVYISAGNSGETNINILSLVKGVKTVGALNVESGVAKYSANNGFVRDWAKATQRFLPVKNQAGKLDGLTLNEVDKAPRVSLNSDDILFSMDNIQMRPWGKGKWHEGLKDAGILTHPLNGTSFAAPQVAAKKAQKIHWLRKALGLG